MRRIIVLMVSTYALGAVAQGTVAITPSATLAVRVVPYTDVAVPTYQGTALPPSTPQGYSALRIQHMHNLMSCNPFANVRYDKPLIACLN